MRFCTAIATELPGPGAIGRLPGVHPVDSIQIR